MQKDLGEDARKIRLSLSPKVSLRELARRMNLSAGFVCDLEKGRRNWTLKTLAAWRKALKV